MSEGVREGVSEGVSEGVREGGNEGVSEGVKAFRGSAIFQEKEIHTTQAKERRKEEGGEGKMEGYTLSSPVLVPIYRRLYEGSKANAVASLGKPW